MPPKNKEKKPGRIKAVRQGHRTTAKQIAYTVNEELDVPNSEEVTHNQRALRVSKLRQQRNTLHDKLGTLRSLDEEILALVEEEEIENEIQEADLVSELIQLSITRIDEFLESKSSAKIVDAPTQHEPLVSPHNFVPSEVVSGNLESSNDPVNNSESSSSPASAEPSVSVHEATPQVKLPKLDLKKFN